MEDIKPIVKRQQTAATTPPPRTKGSISQLEIRPGMTRIPTDFEPDAHKPRYFLWVIAIISVLVLFISISYVFSGATVTLAAKTQSASINETFTAAKDTTDPDVVPFDLMIIKSEKSKTALSTGTKPSEEKATGKVTLSNSFGPAIQHLKEETRLEAANGKIYKIVGPTDIPGAKTVDGKLVPGTVEVSVFAENPGPDYNTTSPTDLKIFGFKGTPKYDKFDGHAELPITGGEAGNIPSVSDADLVAVKAELKGSLESDLIQKTKAELPAGFLLYDEATFLRFDEPKLSANSETEAKITQNGNLYAFIFNEKKLTKKIAERVIRNYDGSEVSIKDIKKLKFSLKNKESVNPLDPKDINFTLEGDALFVPVLLEDTIKKALIGVSKNDFNSVMEKFKGVLNAQLSIRPFWKGTLPSNPDSIKIIISGDTTVKK